MDVKAYLLKHIKALETGKGRKPKYTSEEILDVVIMMLQLSIPWRRLPKGGPTYTNVFYHFKKWVKYDVFRKAFAEMRQDYEMKRKVQNNVINLLVDGTFAHSKNYEFQGDTGYGFKGKGNTIFLACDLSGMPLYADISGCQIHEKHMLTTYVQALQNHKDKRFTILADKGFCDPLSHISNELMSNVAVVTPRKKNATHPDCRSDKQIQLLKLRYRIENTFAKLKLFRRIEIRWERIRAHYFAFVLLSCMFIYN